VPIVYPGGGYNITCRARFNDGGGFESGGGMRVADGEQQWETDQVRGAADDSTQSTIETLFGDNENYNFSKGGACDRKTHPRLVPGVTRTPG
jgi:hypothetical protein